MYNQFLPSQIEAVLLQYEIEIKEVIKGRGCYICDTDRGKKVLIPFRGAQEKGMLLCRILSNIEEKGFSVEQAEITKSGLALAEDEYTGERFLLKTYVEGVEISTSRTEEMKEAIRMLAMYHNVVEGILMETLPEGRKEMIQVWQRHYKELIKVRNYIRNRKKKNEFEQIYMKHFEHNRKSAEESLRLMESFGEPLPREVICHGDYNQHNVLNCDGTYRIVNFESFVYQSGMVDLANFLRKMLEKNDWSQELGRELIQTYHANRPIRREEYRQLHGLLLFPEKYWKVTNHYMNSRKSWISGRDIDKLKKVMEQEEKRLIFMENVFAFLK